MTMIPGLIKEPFHKHFVIKTSVWGQARCNSSFESTAGTLAEKDAKYLVTWLGWRKWEVKEWIRERDPFNQTFRKFRSKTQWIGSVQPEKFRKNGSTFWGGPLFPVGPVGILVEWIAPRVCTGGTTPPQSGHGRFNFLLREMWKTSLTWERGSWSYKFILYKTSLNERLNNFHASKSSSWPPRGVLDISLGI